MFANWRQDSYTWSSLSFGRFSSHLLEGEGLGVGGGGASLQNGNMKIFSDEVWTTRFGAPGLTPWISWSDFRCILLKKQDFPGFGLDWPGRNRRNKANTFAFWGWGGVWGWWGYLRFHIFQWAVLMSMRAMRPVRFAMACQILTHMLSHTSCMIEFLCRIGRAVVYIAPIQTNDGQRLRKRADSRMFWATAQTEWSESQKKWKSLCTQTSSLLCRGILQHDDTHIHVLSTVFTRVRLTKHGIAGCRLQNTDTCECPYPKIFCRSYLFARSHETHAPWHYAYLIVLSRGSAWKSCRGSTFPLSLWGWALCWGIATPNYWIAHTKKFQAGIARLEMLNILQQKSVWKSDSRVAEVTRMLKEIWETRPSKGRAHSGRLRGLQDSVQLSTSSPLTVTIPKNHHQKLWQAMRMLAWSQMHVRYGSEPTGTIFRSPMSKPWSPVHFSPPPRFTNWLGDVYELLWLCCF